LVIALLIPAVLSCLLLAAHFLRQGSMFLTGVSLAVPLLLFIRHRAIVRLMQVILIIAALEWVRTAVVSAEKRIDAGDPWQRMAIILGAVALWTIGSALLFETPPLRRRYRRSKAGVTKPEDTTV
jgi:hypothetical protein